MLDKFISLNNSAFNPFTFPLAIKFLNLPWSVKKISISEINFPSLILLFNKFLKFDGLIIADNSLICVRFNSSKIILIFFIFISELNNDKKSI